MVGALVGGAVDGWRLLWKVDPVSGALNGGLAGATGGAVPMKLELWQVSELEQLVAQWRYDRWMQWRCDWIQCLFVFVWLLHLVMGKLTSWSTLVETVELNKRQTECVNDCFL